MITLAGRGFEKLVAFQGQMWNVGQVLFPASGWKFSTLFSTRRRFWFFEKTEPRRAGILANFAPKMKRLRAARRLLLLSTFTIWKTGKALLPVLTRRGYDLGHALRTRREWAALITHKVGIRARFHGNVPDFPCLLLANHRSYLDPILILAVTEAFPVSKAEARKWPVLGAGAAATGVIFLKRESLKSRADTMQAIADKVKEGHRVILFPEGTTSAVPTTIEFKKGSFQLAARNGIPVVPVAIDYRDARDFWVGKESFVGHFFRTFGERRKFVDVTFCEKIESADWQFLMRETRARIDAVLLSGAAPKGASG